MSRAKSEEHFDRDDSRVIPQYVCTLQTRYLAHSPTERIGYRALEQRVGIVYCLLVRGRHEVEE